MVAHDANIGADLARLLRNVQPVTKLDVRSVTPFGSGHSGFTYAVDVGRDRPLVLRLSPPGVRIAGPADIGRQGRIMGALHAQGLPVPRILACSSEPVVDGRSFALMELVDGEDWSSTATQYGGHHLARRAIDVLHRIAAIEPEHSGISAESPITARAELARWATLVDRAPDFLQKRARELQTALSARQVDETSPTLVHGDYHYGNLLFAGGEIVAVVDWEISQLGQPLLDLGCLAVTSLRRRYAPDPNPTGDVGVSIAELMDMYGTSEDVATWYVALSCFKYGAILGYNLQLHRSGRRPDPMYEELRRTMSALLDDGVRILRDGVAVVDWS